MKICEKIRELGTLMGNLSIATTFNLNTVLDIIRNQELSVSLNSLEQINHVCFRYSSVSDMEDLRLWCLDLPSNVRNSILDMLYSLECPRASSKLTRSEYFHMMSACWQVLYTPDWTRINIPDLQYLVQSRTDIKTDSPSALEDVERVLRRLGIVPSSVPPVYGNSVTYDKARDTRRHMGHTDIYSSIYDIILSFDHSKAQVLKLQAYSNKNVYSIREKQLLYSIIPQLRYVQVLELGHAADDVILQQIGATCSSLKKLVIAGSEVTDTGFELMLEEGRSSGLSQSLQSLTLHSTALVTLHGVCQALEVLTNLSHISVQESIILQLLRHEQCELLNIPVRTLELTLGTGRRDYLGPASTMFTQLNQLTLWCFEPENASSLSGFSDWSQWTQLTHITLNNVAYCDLLEIVHNIGQQLTHLDIDNFSNDETDMHIYLDVYIIGKCCPNLETLSLSMAFVDYLPPKFTTSSSSVFQSLTNLHLKSNKYKTPNVLPLILSQAINVVKLTVQFQVTRPFIEVEEAETLKDDDIIDIIKMNNFKQLKNIAFLALEHPHSIGCKLPLTDVTISLLLTHCPQLESIGDISKWNLEDMDRTMLILNTHWGWTKSV